jgi:hypothetical protein
LSKENELQPHLPVDEVTPAEDIETDPDDVNVTFIAHRRGISAPVFGHEYQMFIVTKPNKSPSDKKPIQVKLPLTPSKCTVTVVGPSRLGPMKSNFQESGALLCAENGKSRTTGLSWHTRPRHHLLSLSRPSPDPSCVRGDYEPNPVPKTGFYHIIASVPSGTNGSKKPNATRINKLSWETSTLHFQA